MRIVLVPHAARAIDHAATVDRKVVRTLRPEQAATHLGWLDKFRDADGSYWMGMQVEEKTFWPVEQPAWTAGAVLLAHDAVHRMTPAHGVLIESII